MRLTIERDALVKLLSHVQGAVERKTTIPILSTVKLEASIGRLAAIGTNLDIEARAAAECEVSEGGAIAAPIDTLAGFARKLPTGASVTLETDQDVANAPLQLIVKSGRARLAIPLMSAGDFPAFATLDMATSFTIDAPALARLIDKTRFAISTEQTRYYLNGIYLHARERNGDQRLAAVATDGHRMAYADTDRPSLDGELPAVIVPKATIAEVRKLIADYAGDVEVKVSPTLIAFAIDGAGLASKLIDGSFPEYQRIVPRDPENTITFDRAALSDALGRALIVADSDARSVRFEAREDSLTVRARTPDRGEAADEIAASANAAFECAFNGRYLGDALAACEGETAELKIGDASAPALIGNPDDKHAFVVLMPLRTS